MNIVLGISIILLLLFIIIGLFYVFKEFNKYLERQYTFDMRVKDIQRKRRSDALKEKYPSAKDYE